jgi:hypothetical protein
MVASGEMSGMESVAAANLTAWLRRSDSGRDTIRPEPKFYRALGSGQAIREQKS